MYHTRLLLILSVSICLISLCSCREQKRSLSPDKAEVKLSKAALVRARMQALLESRHVKDDSPDMPVLFMKPALVSFYSENDFNPVWVDTGYWTRPASKLFAYLDTASRDGLFPEEYLLPQLREMRDKLSRDSLARKDGAAWARVELMLSNAFMHAAMDLKQGRLRPDSQRWVFKDSYHRTFFSPLLKKAAANHDINTIFTELRPTWPLYDSIRAALPDFLATMDTARYTYLDYPYVKGDSADSVRFVVLLRKRLNEAGVKGLDMKKMPDSATLSHAVKEYQRKHALETDGKVGPQLIRKLNATDRVKRISAAIALDRLKELPDSVPETYIWVNLPAYELAVVHMDTLVFSSRIICGKPVTPTPEISSTISDMVVFPTWTVPESIIRKEMLPGLKKNPGYLARKGLSLYKYNGEKVDPSSINWSRYTKGIPFKIQQGSGEDNALGVIKFNFDNPYFVYLHDTNQRYLFRNKLRALSHGCVRVQEWAKLAEWLIRYDSLNLAPGDSLAYNLDSINNWIAQKRKHRVQVRERAPLYIRYLACAAKSGRLVFYDDIYQEDKRLRERYFKGLF